MARKKTHQVEFEGFEEVLQKLVKLEANIEEITNEGLVKSKRQVQQNLGQAMEKHNWTFRTVRSLSKDNTPHWSGTQGTLPVGFNISHGGLPSIFLMYGTPRMNKDTKLYNAIYGSKTAKEVLQIQQDIYYQALRGLE